MARISQINKLKRVAFSFMACLAVTACAQRVGPAASPTLVTPSLLSHSERPRDLLTINSLAVLPPHFDPRARSAESLAPSFYDDLERAAQEHVELALAPSQEVRAAVSRASGRSNALALGKELGADAVLRTEILRYVTREGSAVGATQGAAVDFAMTMVRVSDGKEVWRASYHFEDQPLSENLFKIRQRFGGSEGAGWRSAQALLQDGFRQAFREFSDKRFAEFSAR